MAPLQNVQHIHFKITECFVDKGFVRQPSELGKKSLIDHNRRFTQGSAFLPPVNEEAIYGSLARSHLNIALRCIRSGLLGSPAGILKFPPPVNEEAIYGSLARSHLSIALRCIRSGLGSPAGILKDRVADEGPFTDVVQHGHSSSLESTW